VLPPVGKAKLEKMGERRIEGTPEEASMRKG
jgi:hypothetical protein